VPTSINTYVVGELTNKQQAEALKLSEEQMRVQRLQAQQEIEIMRMKKEAEREEKRKDAEAEIEIERMKKAAQQEQRTKHKADAVSDAAVASISVWQCNSVTMLLHSL
jgi:hypothetical protein